MGSHLHPLLFSKRVMRIKPDYIIYDYEGIYESLSTIQIQEIIVIMKLQTQTFLDTEPNFPPREIMVSQIVYKAWRRQLEN